jgi:hypothetical protein
MVVAVEVALNVRMKAEPHFEPSNANVTISNLKQNCQSDHAKIVSLGSLSFYFFRLKKASRL